MEHKYLIELGQKGYILAPGESLEDFVDRVNLIDKLKKNGPSILEKIERQDVTLQCLEMQFLDMNVNWVPYFVSSKKIPIWCGAMTWYIDDECGISFPLVQISKRLLFGLYDQDEFIKHELVHAIRSNFNEKVFEEVIAYHTSSNKIRRFIGPLIRSQTEAVCLLISMAFPLLVNLGFSLAFLLIPVLFLTYLFARLVWVQRIFRKAMRNISAKFPKSVDPLQVIIRLSDEEIIEMSRNPDGLLKNQKKISSLRWKQILACGRI